MPANEVSSGGSESFAQLRDRLEAESGDSLKLLAHPDDNPICSVSLDSQLPAVIVTWKRYATSTQLRFIHEYVLDLLRQRKLIKLLEDQTSLATIHSEDQDWIAKDWMPRAVAAGLHAIAAKSPTSYFGNLSVSHIHARAPKSLAIRAFTDLDDCRQWLGAAQ